MRCKSAIVCPVCAPWQSRKLQSRLQEVADTVVAAGGWVGMQTLTVRHDQSHDLKHLRRVATEALRRVLSGRGWLKLKCEGGLLGQAKVVEAPWGPSHGWHLHLHLLLVLDHRDEARARSAAAGLQARWIDAVAALGLDALSIGQKFELCYDPAGAAGYCAKLAAELAHGWAKQLDEAQNPHALVGIFTLAYRAMAGDQQADRLFLEYAEAMSGLQQGRVSKPLREALKLTERPAFDGGVVKDRSGETVGCQSREQYMEIYARGMLPEVVAIIEGECQPEVGIGGWPRVIDRIDAMLRPLPQPPRPTWRIPAELIAREARARRPAFPNASTAELVERTLHEYRSRRYAGLVIVLPDANAVLAELASS